MKTWNSMDKSERLSVFMYVLDVADREKDFGDEQSEILKKEIKRIDGLHRYNGCYPLIFNDAYGICASFSYSGKVPIVTQLDNAKGQGELSATLLLLYQAKFNFDEKNMMESEFSFIIMTLGVVEPRKLFKGIALYLKNNRVPKFVKDFY